MDYSKVINILILVYEFFYHSSFFTLRLHNKNCDQIFSVLIFCILFICHLSVSSILQFGEKITLKCYKLAEILDKMFSDHFVIRKNFCLFCLHFTTFPAASVRLMHVTERCTWQFQTSQISKLQLLLMHKFTKGTCFRVQFATGCFQVMSSVNSQHKISKQNSKPLACCW